MAEIRLTRVEQGQTKIRNVPIAVTPEGFWCCPSPVVFQKTLKPQNNPLNKPKPSSPPHKPNHQKKPNPATMNERRSSAIEIPPEPPAVLVAERPPRQKPEAPPRKVAIEFGEPGTSDMKVVLLGKQGFCVKMSVHRDVLVDHSRFFADKIDMDSPCLEIDECEDVEIYVETVGLMYCKEIKQRLIKQSVSRVLRILKVAELLRFNNCIHSCLEYLEAVPWVGEEEEERVISSVTRLQIEGINNTPILKRVSSSTSKPTTPQQQNTLAKIVDLVLGSTDDRSRREMKSVVLNLLRENQNQNGHEETIYASCRVCLGSLLSLFETSVVDNGRRIGLESDNLSWLLEILTERRAADEFAAMWASQGQLARLHMSVPVVVRYHVSAVTARLFVGIGKGEILPCQDTRRALLVTWLQPLIDDYGWLQNGCRPFDRKVVEEGIGRTILTLPLDDQQTILLSWLGSFLRSGDNCPNLQRAFEVWWRRTFVRPFVVTEES